MDIRISIFNIDTYDDALALWQQSEGVGLSDADSREGIAAYLGRNPGMSFIAATNGRVVGTIPAVTMAGADTFIILRFIQAIGVEASPGDSLIGVLEHLLSQVFRNVISLFLMIMLVA